MNRRNSYLLWLLWNHNVDVLVNFQLVKGNSRRIKKNNNVINSNLIYLLQRACYACR